MMNVKKLHPRYDDVDLAKRSNREGCVEVENGEKGKKRRVGESESKKRSTWHQSWAKGSGPSGCFFSFFFFKHTHQVYSFPGFLCSRNRAHFLIFLFLCQF